VNLPVRALHGVAHVQANTPADIAGAVHQLLHRLPIAAGGVVLSVIFTSTSDLDAAFPATVAREWGVQAAVFGLQAAGEPVGRIEMLAHVTDDR
jgi:chorismate mutase